MHMICRSLRLSTCGGRRTIERSERSHCNYQLKTSCERSFPESADTEYCSPIVSVCDPNAHEPYKEPTSMSGAKDKTIALADSKEH